jgi:hypothetical protein
MGPAYLPSDAGRWCLKGYKTSVVYEFCKPHPAGASMILSHMAGAEVTTLTDVGQKSERVQEGGVW